MSVQRVNAPFAAKLMRSGYFMQRKIADISSARKIKFIVFFLNFITFYNIWISLVWILQKNN